MKRFVWIAAAVVGLLVAVALIVPFLVPNDVYRSRIETAASDALGREVTLTGDVGLSLFPSISAKIEGVSVANPEGFSRDNMIEAGALRGVVKWGPLLARRVEIAEIVFEDADVQLERRADGQANWEFGAAEPSEPAPEDEGVGGAVDAGIDTASLRNARLAFIDATSGASYEIAELNLTAQMRAMDTPLQLDADGLFQGQDFELDLTLATLDALLGGAAADVEATIGVAGGDARYDGALTLSDELQLDGAYSVSARALQNLAELAGIDLGYNLAVLGNVRAEGRLAGPLSALKINFERATIDGDGLGASYTGDVTLGDSVTLGGSFSAESRDLPAWLGDFGIQLPEAANVLENVSVSANLTGALDTLKVSGIELRQVGPLLNAEYLGDVSLGGDGRFQGEVETSSGALRSLLDTVGVEMAPGDTLQSFDVNGAVSGTFSRFSVSGLTAELDDVAAAGDLTFDVSGERPRLSGVLTTGTLDLSSFLGQGGGTSSGTQQQGWSDEKLDLAGLKTMDTDIAIQADKIIIGDIELVEADLSAQLTNGDFNANITSMQAFGGQWAGMFGLDARGDLPELDIDLTGETIQLNSALSALAGLDALSGLGQLRVDVTSRGDSLQALVGGLTGEMDSSLADGALKGINLGQLVRSRDNILESITSGQLALALEPEAETDFTSLLAGLSLNNGVASIDTFNLVSPVMTLDGGGSINLLSQTLDVSIVPTLDTSGQGGGSALQLNGVPVPFKISGSWLSPGISPDMQMLQSLVRQDLTGRVQDQLRGQVGGELGGVIGGLIGGGQTAAPQPAIDNAEPTATADGAAPEAEADPKSLEEELEGRARSEVRDALGGLFGRSSDDDKDEDAEETSD